MKNIKIILFAFLSLILTTGCEKDFEELNTDPNNPTVIPADLLLGYSQRIYANVIYNMQAGGDMGDAGHSNGPKFSTMMRSVIFQEEP